MPEIDTCKENELLFIILVREKQKYFFVFDRSFSLNTNFTI